MKSQVFNIDCMIGMKEYPDNYFDLAVVDPWYQNNDAVNLVNGKTNLANRTSMRIDENIAPVDSYFIELKRITKNTIIWGGNYFGLKGGIIAWNKYGTAFGEGEVAICTTHNSVRSNSTNGYSKTMQRKGRRFLTLILVREVLE